MKNNLAVRTEYYRLKNCTIFCALIATTFFLGVPVDSLSADTDTVDKIPDMVFIAADRVTPGNSNSSIVYISPDLRKFSTIRKDESAAISSIAASVDGTQIAIASRVKDKSVVYVQDVRMGKSKAIAYGHSPAWNTKKKNELAFVCPFKKVNAICTWDSEGKRVQRLLIYEEPLSSVKWGNNGKTIYFLVGDGEKRRSE